MLKLFFLLLFSGTVHSCQAQGVAIDVLHQGKETSLRGLFVLDDSVAWVSGGNGWVARTTDRGETWDWRQVPSHETVDFRDIQVFSTNEALIISAGSPAIILRTTDGGHSWQETHRDGRPAIFFDGMDFWDDRMGLAYGDPIDGVMQLLATSDGGQTWRDISGQATVRLSEGEAGFAASGTGVRTLPGGHVFIASGGHQSRLFHSMDYGQTWTARACPIVQGSASKGIFSIAFQDEYHGVVVGGDYQQDTLAEDAVFVTEDGGLTWAPPKRGTRGYRSAVEYINSKMLVAAGTTGVDISRDGGHHWDAVSDASFHVVRKAKNGTWVVLAGADGRIATLLIDTNARNSGFEEK